MRIPSTNKRRAIAIVALVAVVVGGIAFAALRHPAAYRELLAPGGDSSSSRAFFSSASPSAVDAIELQYASGASLRLARNDGKWFVDTPQGPFAIRADRAGRLFAAADGKPEVVRWMQAALPPHEETAGRWDRPDVSAVFSVDGAEVETLMVGRCLMKGDLARTEVRGRGDDRYFLAVGDLTDNFAGESVLDWVPTRLLPDVDAKAVRSIRTTFAGGEWLLSRDDVGAWTVSFEGGRPVPAIADRAERAAAALADLRIDGFPQVAAGARLRPVWTISFEADGAPPAILKVGEETAPNSGLHLAWISDDDPPRAIHRPMALVRDGRDFAEGTAVARAERTP